MSEDVFQEATASANETMLATSVGKRVMYSATAARGAYWALTQERGAMPPVPDHVCTAIMQQAFSYAWHEFSELEARA